MKNENRIANAWELYEMWKYPSDPSWLDMTMAAQEQWQTFVEKLEARKWELLR